jgi:hypothetical protein
MATVGMKSSVSLPGSNKLLGTFPQAQFSIHAHTLHGIVASTIAVGMVAVCVPSAVYMAV